MVAHARTALPPEQRKKRPLTKRLQEDARARIDAGILLKILKDHASGKSVVEDQSRIKAAEILLRKVLPDLSSIEYQEREELPQENQLLDRIWNILSAHPDLLRTMQRRIEEHLQAGMRPVAAAHESESGPSDAQQAA